VRDRRYDWLYERQKQPVKQYLPERVAAELDAELRAWPPGALEWESEAQRRQWGAGAAAPPREQVVRFALELSRLDLMREWEELERRQASEGARHYQDAAEAAAGHLLVRLVTERCLALKEYAEGAGLTREDLVGAVGSVEKRLFRVTLG